MANEIQITEKEHLRKLAIDYITPALIGKKVSDTEKEVAINYAVEKGLNPAKGEVYFLPFNKNIGSRDNPQWTTIITPVTSYEVYLARADEMLDGFDVIFQGDEFDENGVPIKINGSPDWIKIDIWRKDRSRKISLVYTRTQLQGNKKTSFWNDDPRTMMQKCAISRAFRIAFPKINLPYSKDELYGLKEIENNEDFNSENQSPVTKPKINPPKQKSKKVESEPNAQSVGNITSEEQDSAIEAEFEQIDEDPNMNEKHEDKEQYMANVISTINAYCKLSTVKSTDAKVVSGILNRINDKLPEGLKVSSLAEAAIKDRDLLDEQLESIKKYIGSVKK